jgi:hypothetical protein
MSSQTPPNDPWSHIQPDDHAQPPEKKRKKRRWLKVLIVLVLLLVALVALIPTILSTGPGTSFLLGRVNAMLHGKAHVNDLSIGWFSGADVNGLKVEDAEGATILTLARLRVPLALTDAIRGNYALGDVLVERPDIIKLQFYEDGSNNFQRLMGEPPTTQPADDDGGGELPRFSGKITVNHLSGTVHHPSMPAPLEIEPSSLVLNIPDSNQPIENDIKLAYRIGQNAVGTITASGKIDLIENNRVQLDKLSGDEAITLAGISMAPVGAIMSSPQAKTTIAGVANGQIELNSRADGGMNLAGELKVDQFAYGGDALQGDKFATSVLRIPVNVSATQAGDATTLKITNTRIEFDQGSIDITADAPMEALANAASNKQPGGEGKAHVTIDIPKLGELANQMPRTFALVEGIKLESGKYHHELDVTLTKDRATVASALKLAEVRGTDTSTGQPLRPIDPIALTFSASSLGGGGTIPDLRDISIALESAFATARGGGESLANTQVTAEFALATLREQLGQYITALDALHSGAGKLVIKTKGDLTQPGPIAANADLTVTDLLYISPPDPQSATQPTTQPAEPTRFEEKWLNVTLAADLQRGTEQFIDAVRDLQTTLKTGDPNSPTVNVSGGGDLSLAGEAMTGKLALKVGADLPALHRKFAATGGAPEQPAAVAARPAPAAEKPITGNEVIGRPAPAAPAPAPAAAPAEPADAEQPLPPLEMVSGSANGTVNVAFSGEGQKIDVQDMRISNLALRRGPGAFQAEQDMLINLAATMRGSEEASEIRVESLDANLGVARATLVTPFVMRTLPSGSNETSGTLKVDGQIDRISRLLEALQGQPAGEGFPYGGTLAMTQAITSSGDATTIKGDLRATDFVVYQAGKPAFTEKQLQLKQDVRINSASESLSLDNLVLDMASSKALRLTLAGAIRQWQTTRVFDNVKADVSYDLAQLWPIIRPLIAEAPEDYKDLVIAGTDNRTFILRGSYPAGKPFHEAIKSLEADGGFAVGQFSYLGINIDKLEIPVTLRKGVMETAYSDRPRARRYAPPAICNGGELNLAGIFVDLGFEQPRLSIPKDHKLLTGVTMNPLFSDNILGTFINPTFVDPEEAQGLVDIQIVACEKVPIGDLIKGRNDGRAEILMSIREVNIGNKFVNQLVGALKPNAFRNGALQGNINNARLVIQNGQLSQNLAIQVEDVALAFDGTVRLVDQALVPLNFTIPSALLEQIPERYLKYVPETVKVPITGTTRAPKWNLDRVVAQLVTEAGKKALLGGALDQLGGERRPNGTTTAPAKDEPQKRIGDLIDSLTRPRNSPPPAKDSEPVRGDEPISQPRR